MSGIIELICSLVYLNMFHSKGLKEMKDKAITGVCVRMR